MKLFIFSAVLFFISSGYSVQAQTSGGPDTFGYNWANNLDPIGSAPVYLWKSIKDTANLVSGLGDDNSSGPFDPGFYYNYYGQWYNTLWIGSNGWVSFRNAGNITAPFPVIPTPSAPDNIIAGLLSDLTFKGANDSLVPGAAAYFWTNNTDSIIIQYDSVPFWDIGAAGYSGRNTFQIILDAADYSITFQYKQLMNSAPGYDLINTGLKTGIEDSTGNDGLQVLDTFPPSGSAVKFFYPGHFSTNDLNNAAISLGQNYPNPSSDLTRINYSVQKSGNVKISIQSLVGTQVETFDLGKIPAGNQSFALHTQSYPPGVYFYSLSIEGASSVKKMVIAK
ncbi:MAG: T9SS type A sorting domain-containing protein [Bacteroidetes bacterium]|nr:MAG: T9SS type A sorting domain-containing protein [Bacteroidota bacterium]